MAVLVILCALTVVHCAFTVSHSASIVHNVSLSHTLCSHCRTLCFHCLSLRLFRPLCACSDAVLTLTCTRKDMVGVCKILSDQMTKLSDIDMDSVNLTFGLFYLMQIHRSEVRDCFICFWLLSSQCFLPSSPYFSVLFTTLSSSLHYASSSLLCTLSSLFLFMIHRSEV